MINVTEGPATGWWPRTVAKEAARDRLGLGERLSNVVGAIIVVLIAIFFLYLQSRGLLFTSRFQGVEQVLFYGAILYGVVPNLARAVIARRNLGRLLDLIGSALFVAVTAYFIVVFPFDVPTLIVEIVPASLAPMLDWLTNTLVQYLLMLAIVITVIASAYQAVLYLSVRRYLRTRPS